MSKKYTLTNSQIGEIEVDSEKVIRFSEGLIGFEDLRDFVIVQLIDYEPFQWLVSVDDSDLAFPIVSPILVVEDYKPNLKVDDAKHIGDFKDEDLLLYAIVTIRPEVGMVTANLKGPVIINQTLKLGEQVVVNDDSYLTNQNFLSL